MALGLPQGTRTLIMSGYSSLVIGFANWAARPGRVELWIAMR